MNKITHSAPVDNRSEAINQFGFVLSKFTDYNIVRIESDIVDRNIARVTLHCPVRHVDYTVSVNIAGDSEMEAIKDIIKFIEEKA